ncbi:MAG TPA: glycosyltransferase [Caulobacteraceae bacterium]|nr:glycosyltransferase [Caulobacteraceae bacterium]
MTERAPERGRIALVLPDLRPGGVERVRLLLAHEFVQRGYAVDLVLMQARGELLQEVGPNVEVVDLQAARIRQLPFALAAYLRRRRPEALMAAMWPLTGVAVLARVLAGWQGRLLVSEHNTLTRTPAYRGLSGGLHRAFGRWLYGHADAVVCVSQGVADDIATATGVARERLHIVHNPIRKPSAEGATDPDIMRWWAQDGTRLISIGSLKAQKDHATLLHALARLRQRRPARLLILGEGELRTELEAQARALGVQDSILMPGFVTDPYPYLAGADLFVLSSAWEGLGNVITEALAVGTPVVSTDCPSGPAEILEQGRFGRLAPVGDPQALARAIEAALDAPVDAALLKSRAADFSVERAADQYLGLLDLGATP